MHRISMILLAVGLVVPQLATAAVWSVKSDCKDGDWTVSVELTGFGPVADDPSCLDGMETHLFVDVGEAVVTGGVIAATSASGETLCDLTMGSDFKFTLECASKTEDLVGFEVEEKVEVEVELEDAGNVVGGPPAGHGPPGGDGPPGNNGPPADEDPGPILN